MASVKGGDLFDKALQDLAKKLDGQPHVRVGFLEGSTYPDGTSTPMVAAILEFGAPARKIPPRPFFRTMVAEKSPAWPKAIGDLLVANSYDAKKTLAQAGEAIAGQLRQSIVDFTSPPLAPSTVARKGFDKPLVDAAKGTADKQGTPQAAYLLRQAGIDQDTAMLLIQGREKLMESLRRSGKLGLIRKEDTEAAQKLQTSIETLRQTSESFGRAIMTAITPTLVEIVGRMQAWVEANKAWIQTEIVDKVKQFAEYLRNIDWQGIGEGLKNFIDKANEGAKALGGWKTVAEVFFGLWAASRIAALFGPILGSIATVRLALMGLGPVGWGLLGVGAVGAALASADPNKAIVSGGRPSGGRNPGDDLPGLGHLGERDGGARNRTGLRARAARAKHVDGPLTQNYPAGLADGIRTSAKDLGISPRDLATAISYETGGTFDPWKSGPYTKWGHHRGLIQWGEPQAAQYGVTKDMSPGDQMKAVTRYLRNAGVKPGTGLPEIYSAINAGHVGRMGASDRPGYTVQRHVNEMRGPHGRNADRLLDAGTAPKPSAWNGIPGASDAVTTTQAIMAARYGGGGNTTSNDNRSETHFHGDWHIQTAATDGAGLATDLRKTMRGSSFGWGVNSGQA